MQLDQNTRLPLSCSEKPLTIKNINGVVTISGTVEVGLPGPNGIVVGKLSSHLSPEKDLRFLCYNDGVSRIDVLKTGHIVVVDLVRPMSRINLTGIQFPIKYESILALTNGWNHFQRECSLTIKNGVAYLSGSIIGGVINTPFCLLPENARPNSRLVFVSSRHDYKSRIEIFPDGFCWIRSNSLFNQKWHSIDGICFNLTNSSIKLTTQEGWEPYGHSYSQPHFWYCDAEEHIIVGLSGLVKSIFNVKGPIAKIPASFAPSHVMHFCSDNFRNNKDLVHLSVLPNGDIVARNTIAWPDTDSNLNDSLVSLNNVVYVIEKKRGDCTYSKPEREPEIDLEAFVSEALNTRYYIKNNLNKTFLTTTRMFYFHSGSSRKDQVVGELVVDNKRSCLWKVIPLSGDLIALENQLEKKYLASSSDYISPNGYTEVHLRDDIDLSACWEIIPLDPYDHYGEPVKIRNTLTGEFLDSEFSNMKIDKSLGVQKREVFGTKAEKNSGTIWIITKENYFPRITATMT